LVVDEVGAVLFVAAEAVEVLAELRLHLRVFLLQQCL
jgi:hypothetical protein